MDIIIRLFDFPINTAYKLTILIELTQRRALAKYIYFVSQSLRTSYLNAFTTISSCDKMTATNGSSAYIFFL